MPSPTPIHVDVKLDRLPLSTAEARALTSLTIRESADRSSVVTLVFTGRDPLGQRPARYEDPRFQVGAAVAVALGSPARPVMLGDIASAGVSLSPDGGATLTLTGYGLRNRLGRNPENLAWENETYSGIAARIARKHGLVPRGEPTTAVHPRVDQFNQTDLELLDGLAAEIDYDVWVDLDELWFAPVEQRRGLVVELAAAELLRLDVTTDANDLYDTINAAWESNGQRGVVTVRAEEVGHQLSVRLRQRWGSKALLLPGEAPSPEAARKAATARLAQSIDGHRTLSADCRGRSDLRVGTRVALSGLGGDLDGTIVVTEATHTVSSGTYTTSFTGRRIA